MQLYSLFLATACYFSPVFAVSADVRRGSDEGSQDLAIGGKMDEIVKSLLPQRSTELNPLLHDNQQMLKEGLVKMEELEPTTFLPTDPELHTKDFRFDSLFTAEQEPTDGDYNIDFDFMSVTPEGKVTQFIYEPAIAPVVYEYIKDTTRTDYMGNRLNDAKGKMHPNMCCTVDMDFGVETCYTSDLTCEKRRDANSAKAPPQKDSEESISDRIRRYIFEDDDRNDIGDTSRWPFRAAGKVGNHCSGTLIGPKHVLTAGHCVHSGPGGDWIRNLDFRPGYDDESAVSEPYGKYDWVKATTVTAWTRNGRWSADYALIELANGPGHWMSFGWHSGMSNSWSMNMNGYHGDDWANQQNSYGKVTRVDGSSFRYHWDTTKGTSGSGVYLYRSSTGSRVIYGVNNAQMWRRGDAMLDTDHYDSGHTLPSYNHAVRITSSRFTRICGWIGDARVC